MRISWHVVGCVVLLSATMAASKLTAERKSSVLARPLDSINPQLANFTGKDNPALTEGVLRELKPTSYLTRTYHNDRVNADVFVAYYAQQRAGESMHSPKHCLPGAGWEIWDYSTTEIPASGQNFTVNKYSISNNGKRMVVLYWYQSKDRIVASEYAGKILLARDALLRNSTAASIVRVIVPDQPGAVEDARSLASELIKEVQLSFGS